MGFVASAVESVVNFAGDVVESVGDVVEDVADVVVDAVEVVGNTVEAVIEDPVPTLLAIGGAAIGIPPPVTMAAVTASRGGDLEDIALSAGTSYVAGQAGSFASSSIAPSISSSIAEAGVTGATNEVITNAATSALISGTVSEIKGGSFADGAVAGLTGSLISSGVNEANNLTGDYLSPTTEKIISSGLTSAALGGSGSDVISNALGKSIVSGGLSLASNELSNLLSDPNSRDVEAQAGGYYGGAAPTTIAPPVVAGNDLSPLQYADTSNVGGTRIDVTGSPFYQGMEGSETIQAPEGMRLATYDEANQGGIEATTLPDGQMAFVVPDTQQETPTVQQEETLPIDEAINQIVNNPPAEQPVVSEEQPDFTDQLAGVQQSFQTQFDQLSDAQKDQALALLNQGQSLEQAISSVQTGLTEQIGDVRTGLTDQITGLESNFQSQFDKLSDAQKDQALALLSQGKTLEQAISDVQTGLTEQFQTGINSLETNMNAYMQSGLTRDQAMQMAIDDLGNDVTQSNEDINRQLAELGLDTGIQFDEVGNQINNLGGTLSNLGGTVTGLLGSVSNLGGTVSGLATNVATGQAQTQRQLEGINYQNTMEKLGKILAEPNQKYDSPLKSYLQPSFINSGQAQPSQEKDYSQIIGELASVLGKRGYKVGGEVRYEDNPVEYVEGPEDRYYARHMKRGFAVNGPGTGQSDDIPTMLADGEYVLDSDVVAALGDGSSKAGAEILDKFRENIRAHKRSAPTDKIPPKAKSPLEYLKMAQKPKGSKHG